MPKTIVILHVTLNLPLQPHETHLLREIFMRRAIELSEELHKKNLSDDLFSNEQITDKGIQYLKRYSAVQYSVLNGYGAITAIGPGAAALKILFQTPFIFHRHGKQHRLAIETQKEKRFSLIAKEKKCLFRLNNYMPFKDLKKNADGERYPSFNEWKNLPTEIERLQLIQKKLASNVITFFKHFEVLCAVTVKIEIVCKHAEKWGDFHNKKQKLFDLTIRSNVPLPEGIGIGGAVAYGYGKLLPAENPVRLGSRKVIEGNNAVEKKEMQRRRIPRADSAGKSSLT